MLKATLYSRAALVSSIYAYLSSYYVGCIFRCQAWDDFDDMFFIIILLYLMLLDGQHRIFIGVLHKFRYILSGYRHEALNFIFTGIFTYNIIYCLFSRTALPAYHAYFLLLRPSRLYYANYARASSYANVITSAAFYAAYNDTLRRLILCWYHSTMPQLAGAPITTLLFYIHLRDWVWFVALRHFTFDFIYHFRR